MTSSYLKTSVLARPHEYDESPFSKLSTLDSAFENLLYVWTVALFGEKSLRFPKYEASVDGVLVSVSVYLFTYLTYFVRFTVNENIL